MGSARAQLERRAFQEQFEKEQEQQREGEDRREYAAYASEMRSQRLEPISFESWRKLIPEEFKDSDAQTRGRFASANANWKSLVSLTAERVRGKLLDEDLAELGFDPEDRPIEAELSEPLIRRALEMFIAQEPTYKHDLMWQTLRDFFQRNKLNPQVVENYRRVHALLLKMNLYPSAPEPEAKPVPSTPEGLNEYGVRLEIEPDPEVERMKRIEAYETKPVVWYRGKGYSEADLASLSSDEYARVVRLKRFTGWHHGLRNI